MVSAVASKNRATVSSSVAENWSMTEWLRDKIGVMRCSMSCCPRSVKRSSSFLLSLSSRTRSTKLNEPIPAFRSCPAALDDGANLSTV